MITTDATTPEITTRTTTAPTETLSQVERENAVEVTLAGITVEEVATYYV